jgi:activating signal cointegrator 1
MNTLFEIQNYKVLTVWQPWATLLIYWIKKLETRPSPTSWTAEKGTYLIHAASKWSRGQDRICMCNPFADELYKLGYKSTTNNFGLSLGQIIGSIEVTECRKIVSIGEKPFIDKDAIDNGKLAMFGLDPIDRNEESFGDYREGRYAWLTQNPRILKTPIPYKGGQGYYQNFKGDIEDLVFE